MELKRQIIDRNREQSALYCDPSERVRRATHRQAHPTEIAAFKCMDGRLDLARITKTPPGIIQPFRNVGGLFNLGWPFLGMVIDDWVEYTISRGRNRLIIVTYHFSKGNTHWGCKGQDYDTAKALAAAQALCSQIEDVFGSRVRTTHPIVVGVETDDDVLILHSERDAAVVYDVSEHLKDTERKIAAALRNLYPSMLQRTLDDLLPLVAGNQVHVKETRKTGRHPIELDHAERVIAVGRGFDWMHLPNTALIIGPYDHKWPDAVETAGHIVLNNIQLGRIPVEEGVLVLVSALSHDPIGSFGWNVGVQKTQYLERITLGTLKNRVPDLMPYVRCCCGVLEADTRFLHLLE
jgi:carbonic anhydrase